MDLHIFKVVDAFEKDIRKNICECFESSAFDSQQ